MDFPSNLLPAFSVQRRQRLGAFAQGGRQRFPGSCATLILFGGNDNNGWLSLLCEGLRLFRNHGFHEFAEAAFHLL